MYKNSLKNPPTYCYKVTSFWITHLSITLFFNRQRLKTLLDNLSLLHI